MRKSTQILCCLLSLLLCLLTLTACSTVVMGSLPETVPARVSYDVETAFAGPTAFEYAPLNFDADWVTENFAEAKSDEDGVRLFVLQADEKVFMKMSDEGFTVYDSRDGDNLTARYGVNGVIESAEYYVNWTDVSENTEERTVTRYSYGFENGVLTSEVTEQIHLTGTYDKSTVLWRTTTSYDASGFVTGKHSVYTDGNSNEYAQYVFNALGLCQSISYAMSGADANGEYIVIGSYSTKDGSYLGCTWYDMAKQSYTYYNARGKEISVDDLSALIHES